jgi:hypothetical protein
VALTTTDLVIMGSLDVKAITAGGLAITLYNQLPTMCAGNWDGGRQSGCRCGEPRRRAREINSSTNVRGGEQLGDAGVLAGLEVWRPGW